MILYQKPSILMYHFNELGNNSTRRRLSLILGYRGVLCFLLKVNDMEGEE